MQRASPLFSVSQKLLHKRTFAQQLQITDFLISALSPFLTVSNIIIFDTLLGQPCYFFDSSGNLEQFHDTIKIILSYQNKMSYYISYGIFKDPRKKTGHSFIVISEYNENNSLPPQIICRIGFQKRVVLEDMIISKPDRDFFHKTYLITKEQLEALLIQINFDRKQPLNKIFIAENNKRFQNSQDLHESLPGGPEYSYLTSNCKHYALELLKKIGIIDKSLESTLIQVPVFSGKLNPLVFSTQEDTQTLKWDSPLIVSSGKDISIDTIVYDAGKINGAKPVLKVRSWNDISSSITQIEQTEVASRLSETSSKQPTPSLKKFAISGFLIGGITTAGVSIGWMVAAGIALGALATVATGGIFAAVVIGGAILGSAFFVGMAKISSSKKWSTLFFEPPVQTNKSAVSEASSSNNEVAVPSI